MPAANSLRTPPSRHRVSARMEAARTVLQRAGVSSRSWFNHRGLSRKRTWSAWTSLWSHGAAAADCGSKRTQIRAVARVSPGRFHHGWIRRWRDAWCV